MTLERRDAGPAVERRVLALPDDLRAEGDAKKHIIGHAAVFDRWTTLYEGESLVWREVVRPGAFREAITDRQDVVSLFNHDANYVLGRTASGTLMLTEDATGLLTETDPPDSPTIRDLVLGPIARRDVTQMSFAFTPRRGPEVRTTEKDGRTVTDYGGERVTRWYEKAQLIEERELLSLNLFDISPVTYPAYKDTDVALRERGARREAEIRERVLVAEEARRAGQRRRMYMQLRHLDVRSNGGIT